MNWRDSVCQNSGSATVSDINRYLSPAPSATSPIDRFYQGSKELLTVGTPVFLTAHPSMGPLLLVGLVSLTENYFRDVLSRLVRICPLARAKSAAQQIKLGSVYWHGGGEPERAAFDQMSFAAKDNLVDTCTKFLDFKLSVNSIGEEFDKVCQLRHAIVHSSAILGGLNAIKLNLAPAPTPLQVTVGFAELQEAAEICTALVTSSNRELFVEMSRRWQKEWPKRPAWDPSKRHATFRAIWDVFHSTVDQANATIPSPMSVIVCRNRVSVGSSRVDLQACKLEYSIVSPK